MERRGNPGETGASVAATVRLGQAVVSADRAEAVAIVDPVPVASAAPAPAVIAALAPAALAQMAIAGPVRRVVVAPASPGTRRALPAGKAPAADPAVLISDPSR